MKRAPAIIDDHSLLTGNSPARIAPTLPEAER
jgi:hypothetical protein